MRRGSKEKRERGCGDMCSRKFVTSFTEYNKDKVPMDVATSLAVNHVNLGVVFICVMFVFMFMEKL